MNYNGIRIWYEKEDEIRSTLTIYSDQEWITRIAKFHLGYSLYHEAMRLILQDIREGYLITNMRYYGCPGPTVSYGSERVSKSCMWVIEPGWVTRRSVFCSKYYLMHLLYIWYVVERMFGLVLAATKLFRWSIRVILVLSKYFGRYIAIDLTLYMTYKH